jgi:hypothetical protein
MARILFHPDRPETFAEAIEEKQFLQLASLCLKFHQTWRFWSEVLVPIWVIHQDGVDKKPNRTMEDNRLTK